MRPHAVTRRRAWYAALLVAVLALLGTGRAAATPLVDVPSSTSAGLPADRVGVGVPAYDVGVGVGIGVGAPAYDVGSVAVGVPADDLGSVAASAPLPAAPPYGGLDRHDEADVAARGSGAMPEWIAPLDQYVTTAVFGQRGGSWTTRHTGLDLKAPRGTPVYAVHDGTVVKLAWHKAYGRMVILEVSPGVTVWYCHLSVVTVGPGPVHVGQQLGRVGSTGNASGPHLHLEVRVDDRPTDPAAYLFGDPPGVPTVPPSWLPPEPVVTVANLATLTRRH